MEQKSLELQLGTMRRDLVQDLSIILTNQVKSAITDSILPVVTQTVNEALGKSIKIMEKKQDTKFRAFLSNKEHFQECLDAEDPDNRAPQRLSKKLEDGSAHKNKRSFQVLDMKISKPVKGSLYKERLDKNDFKCIMEDISTEKAALLKSPDFALQVAETCWRGAPNGETSVLGSAFITDIR